MKKPYRAPQVTAVKLDSTANLIGGCKITDGLAGKNTGEFCKNKGGSRCLKSGATS